MLLRKNQGRSPISRGNTSRYLQGCIIRLDSVIIKEIRGLKKPFPRQNVLFGRHFLPCPPLKTYRIAGKTYFKDFMWSQNFLQKNRWASPLINRPNLRFTLSPMNGNDACCEQLF